MNARTLRLAAACLLGATLVCWLVTGANRGWTKTSVPVRRSDPVTGLSVDDYQKRFVPGVDFLALALVASGVLTGVSFLFGNTGPKQDHPNP